MTTIPLTDRFTPNYMLHCSGAKGLEQKSKEGIVEDLAFCIKYYWAMFQHARQEFHDLLEVRGRARELLREKYGMKDEEILAAVTPELERLPNL